MRYRSSFLILDLQSVAHTSIRKRFRFKIKKELNIMSVTIISPQELSEYIVVFFFSQWSWVRNRLRLQVCLFSSFFKQTRTYISWNTVLLFNVVVFTDLNIYIYIYICNNWIKQNKINVTDVYTFLSVSLSWLKVIILNWVPTIYMIMCYILIIRALLPVYLPIYTSCHGALNSC